MVTQNANHNPKQPPAKDLSDIANVDASSSPDIKYMFIKNTSFYDPRLV